MTTLVANANSLSLLLRLNLDRLIWLTRGTRRMVLTKRSDTVRILGRELHASAANAADAKNGNLRRSNDCPRPRRDREALRNASSGTAARRFRRPHRL